MTDHVADFIERTNAERAGEQAKEQELGSNLEPRNSPAPPAEDEDYLSRFLRKTNKRRRHGETLHRV